MLEVVRCGRHRAPTGLNALVAGCVQSFDDRVLDADGVFRSPADARYVYGKLGWKADLSRIGSTAFYGEYGRFEDFVGAGNDGAVVGSLASGRTCAVPSNCRIASSGAEVWGLGVVQELEAAQMQLYLGYRHHSANFKLTDRTGASTSAASFEDFQTVVLGSFIEFRGRVRTYSFPPRVRRNHEIMAVTRCRNQAAARPPMP